jgi:hypothetical protein
MKKKVKIYGKEIKRAVRRGIMENIMEHWEMKDTYSKAKYKQSPREGGIESVFGQYGEEIPSSVLRYLRKNPAAIVKRLHKLYGDDIYKWLPSQSPVMDNWEFEEEEEMVDEALLNVGNEREAVDAEKAGFEGTIQIKKDLGESKKIKTVTVNEIKKMLGRKSKKKNKFRR